MNTYFNNTIETIKYSLSSIDIHDFNKLVLDCETALKKGNKIIPTGLGKNVPICDKFVGTMLSMGLNANFLHTNSAVHGDLGMVKEGDVVIVLTKSGSTEESVYLVDLLEKRNNVVLWLISFNAEGILSMRMKNKILVPLEHEGDLWNIVPNNSTVLNLIVLQALAMELASRLNLDLEKDFKPNHPGGAIGKRLRDE